MMYSAFSAVAGDINESQRIVMNTYRGNSDELQIIAIFLQSLYFILFSCYNILSYFYSFTCQKKGYYI